MYTLLLKNNATRSEYVIRGLADEGTDMIHFFKKFRMPQGAQQGEYTYALFFDEAVGFVNYDLNDNLLETVVTVNGTSIAVKHLNPEVGILSYVEDEEQGAYLVNNKENRYYKK